MMPSMDVSRDADRPEAPWSPSEAWPVLLLFLAYGVAQVANAYLLPNFAGQAVPRQSWGR